MDVKSTKAKTIDENLNLAATISDLRGINFVSCWKLKKDKTLWRLDGSFLPK